jgi:hypothetical protein
LKITRAAYADLQQTLSSLALRSTSTLGYDNATQRPTLIEVDQAIANWRADKARELLDLARAVAEVADGADAKTRRGLDAPVWLGLLPTCRATGHALWCDDAFLRTAARAEGVQAFGTTALLEYLRSTGTLTANQFEEALLDLTNARAVDLPIKEDRLRLVVGLQNWRPESVAITLSRPAAWRSAAVCLPLLLEACQRQVSDIASLTAWFAFAAEGISSLIPDPIRAAEVVAAVLASIISIPQMSAAGVKALLDTARVIANHHGLGEIWPQTSRQVRDWLLTQQDETACRMIMIALTAELDGTDKAAVFRTLIEKARRQPSAE